MYNRADMAGQKSLETQLMLFYTSSQEWAQFHGIFSDSLTEAAEGRMFHTGVHVYMYYVTVNLFRFIYTCISIYAVTIPKLSLEFDKTVRFVVFRKAQCRQVHIV